jgi:hypothetical protein
MEIHFHFPYALPLIVGFGGLMLSIPKPYPRQMGNRLPPWLPMADVVLIVAAFVV